MPTGYLWAKNSTLVAVHFRNLPDVKVTDYNHLSEFPLIAPYDDSKLEIGFNPNIAHHVFMQFRSGCYRAFAVSAQ